MLELHLLSFMVVIGAYIVDGQVIVCTDVKLSWTQAMNHCCRNYAQPYAFESGNIQPTGTFWVADSKPNGTRPPLGNECGSIDMFGNLTFTNNCSTLLGVLCRLNTSLIPEGSASFAPPCPVLPYTKSSTATRTSRTFSPTMSTSITSLISDVNNVTSCMSTRTSSTLSPTMSTSITSIISDVNAVTSSEQNVTERTSERNSSVPSDVDQLSTASKIGIGLGALCVFVITGIIAVFVVYKRKRKTAQDSDEKSQPDLENNALYGTSDISKAVESHNGDKNSRSLTTTSDDGYVYAVPDKKRRKDVVTKDVYHDDKRINGVSTGLDAITNNELHAYAHTRYHAETTLSRGNDVDQSTDGSDYGYNVASINPRPRMDISSDYDRLN